MIKPLGKRVIIEPKPQEDVTKGGIIIPIEAKEKPQEGIVIAAANNLDVKEGDSVMYGKHSGTDFKFEGNDYLIMFEQDIIAIV